MGGYGVIVSSTDGVNWTGRNSGVNYNLTSITYGGGKFIGAGTGYDNQNNPFGTTLSSPDGVTWSVSNPGTTAALNSITYSNGVFVTGGSNGSIFSSQNGSTWTARNSGTVNNLWGITGGDGIFVAAGDGGTLLTSSNGVTWVGRDPGVARPQQLSGIGYGYGTFIAVGANGTILQSQTLEGVGPVTTTGTATGVTLTGATLNGVVNPNGAATSAAFEYSTSPTLVGAAISGGTNIAAGSGPIPVSTTVTGLTPGQTYYFRVQASNVNGQRAGAIVIVNPSRPVITSTTSATGTSGFAFNYQIVATNDPTSFNAIGLPMGLGVDASTGLISGTPSATGTFAATISAVNSGGTGSKTFTLTILPSPPVITSVLTVSGTNGIPFNYQIVASNNPRSFNAAGLPAGLGVAPSTGVISGTPTVTGTYPVTISATNAGGTGSAPLSLILITEPIPVITSALSATGTADFPFTYQITGSNNPSSFSVNGLPQGLSYNTSTGLIFGTPVFTGSFSASISAINLGGTAWATLSLSVETPPVPVLSSAATATGTNGSGFSYQITATNNPTSFSASGLPAGVGYNASTGQISGIPTTTGTFAGTISAINLGGTGSEALTVTVLPTPPVITSILNATGTSGLAFTYQIAASNNPLSFNAVGLPQGLNIDPSTGLISGTAASPGQASVTIIAINTGGTGSATLSLTILPQSPAITSASRATGTNGSPFSYQITASNSPTSFGASGLPPGVGYTASTGMISGLPTATGTFVGTISALNAGGTGTETFTVTILPPPPVITSGLTASGTNGVPFHYQIAASNGPTSLNATGLPAGLNVNPTTGVISGTPATGGTFAVAISAANAGGTGSATLTITMNVAFAGVKGSYSGLASLGGTNLGLFTLSLTPTGGFTGKLTFPSAHYPLKGAFSADGIFVNTVPQGAALLETSLSIDPSKPGVSGTIIVTTGGATSSYAVECGLLGKFKTGSLSAGLPTSYTAIMPVVSGSVSGTQPQAPGYGTMSVGATGAVTLTGKLGDGTAYKAAGQLRTDQKTVTLFAMLYGGKNPGSIAGNIILESATNSDWDGIMDWIKPTQASGAYYASGFSLGVDLMAAKYVAPALAPGNAAFTLGGGDLPDAAVSGTLIITANGKVTVSGTSEATLTLTPKTGAFSGKFLYPGTGKKTSFGGVIYQKMPPPSGFGLFLGADQCGSLEISQ